MRHFKGNCAGRLNSIGIKGREEQGVILQYVFAKDGLVEAENKVVLKKRIESIKDELDQLERSILKQDDEYIASFSKFLFDKEKTVLRKFTRSSRRKVLMVNDEIPPRLYTNQSESVNNIMANRKSSYGLKKKDDVSKMFFPKEIWLKTKEKEKVEIRKALYNDSHEFRLRDHRQIGSVIYNRFGC